MTIDQLEAAGNPLALQALFYSDGVRTHIDLGSNRGQTLQGLPKDGLTAVELYGPSVEELRRQGYNVVAGDVRDVVVGYLSDGRTFDRVTMFDVLEHLPREDGERLIDQIEQLAARDVVFFVPIETPELHSDPEFAAYREWGLQQYEDGQRDLQRHLSYWTQDDFAERGYMTLLLEDFQGGKWPACFAAKYKRDEDADAAVARVRARLDAPPPAPEAHVAEPCFIAGRRHMTLGKGVIVGPYARLECVPLYAGRRHFPRLTIGDNTTIEWNAHIGCAGKISIGRDCIIAGRVTIMDHEHGYNAARALHGQPLDVGEVEVGDGCFIGENAVLLKGARIGAHSVIGAGAVVTGSIPAYSVAVGAPARVVRRTLGLTSIVIPTYNGLDLLQKCLESIETHTPEPHDIIVVDNGSTDGTTEWLTEHRPDVAVVALPENVGYPRGINYGLERATGDYIVTLNNDTEVTAGWLYEMIAVLEADPQCGLVGPMGDNVSGIQKGEPTRGSMVTQRLTGFCLLIRRAVVEQLGGLDTRFGLGNYDDDDYCLRAIIRGWTLRIARAAFVHHVGFQTWERTGTDLSALLEDNRRLFYEKWGLPEDMPEEGAMIDLTAARYIPLVEE